MVKCQTFCSKNIRPSFMSQLKNQAFEVFCKRIERRTNKNNP